MILRSTLDAEMKDATRAGVALQNKKAEKLPVTQEEENKFWEMGLLGCQSAKSLLNTVYFYNGKLFGLRGGEHRNITVANFQLGSNFIRFEENVAKTFHGGLTDLKYEPRQGAKKINFTACPSGKLSPTSTSPKVIFTSPKKNFHEHKKKK